MTFCALTDQPATATTTRRETSLLLVALAVLLLSAAALKGYELATVPLEQRGWVIAQVGFEWVMGAWLLAGIYRRAAWMAALLLFSLFAAVAAHQVTSGAVSCGCFGVVRLDPKYTLALDVTAVGLLLASARSVRRPARPANWQLTIATAAIISGAGIAGMVAMRGLPPIGPVPVLPPEPSSK